MSNLPTDQRETATRVEVRDEDGGRWVGYSFNVKRLHAWLGVIVTLLGIAATVYGSVQVSVRDVVRDEIERQVADDRSPLNRQAAANFDRGCDLNQSDIQARMRTLERELAVLREQNTHANQELAELRADVKELLRRVR